MSQDVLAELMRKVKTLNETVWESRAPGHRVEEWLQNFAEDAPGDSFSERLHALHLLGRFIYFGDAEMREMLRSLYRDVFKYPIVASLRRSNENTRNFELLSSLFQRELAQTRFLGIGNPSESGTHLLYHFRQENSLSKNSFINAHQIFARPTEGATAQRGLRFQDVRRYVFLDDLAASGQQAQEYSTDLVEEILSAKNEAEVWYLTLFATSRALEVIRQTTKFTRVACVMELDESFRAFGAESRYFAEPSTLLSKSFAEAFCRRYGTALWPNHPLGYRDSQLLIGFRHNVPDNTLPVFWFDSANPPWTPMFRRYPKLGGA